MFSTRRGSTGIVERTAPAGRLAAGILALTEVVLTPHPGRRAGIRRGGQDTASLVCPHPAPALR
ncbi:MAG: hypothetical protein WCS99_19795 [Limisphaerales bacterium]